MPANLLGLALPVGALLIAAGSKPKAPEVPSGNGGAGVTTDAANALCEVRLVAGVETRVFRAQVIEMTIAALGESYLVPAPGAPSPEVAAYDVVPVSSTGRQPGQQTAQQIVASVAAQGLIVMGSLSLPVPSVSGRQVLIGQPKARSLAAAAYRFPYALLLDKALSSSQAVPGAPAYTPGPGAPAVPPAPSGGASSPAPYVPGPSAPTPPPPLPGVDEMPGTYAYSGDWDANIPPDVRREVEGMLADEQMQPDALDQAARAMDQSYPKAAAKLRARAAELRTKRELEAARRGGSPHTIRAGDTGSYLAKYYTGDGNRWRELPSANPGMRIVTKNGVSQLEPWSGEILLPLGWRAWTKPEPPLQSGGSTPKSGKAPATSTKTASRTTGKQQSKQSA